MANYWAIAIGINQYQFFQPLSYAQADAEDIRNFLVQEAGFLPDKCLLMTENSPPIRNQSTYPSKDNFLFLLEELANEQLQPDDHLWLFFSGYGVTYNGQDYLMPVEGHPERVLETGIEVRSLYQTLQFTPAGHTLVLLDINRASGMQADSALGQETIELAQELEIPSFVSCQPSEFSRESSELGHGFFTAALLEAWRSGNGNTLEDLENYLSDRLPELCQQHWRPIQNPATIIEPPDIRQDIILPKVALTTYLPQAQAAPTLAPQPEIAPATAAPLEKAKTANTVVPKPEPQPKLPTTSTPASTRAGTSRDQISENTNGVWWQTILLWLGSSVLMLGILLGGFLRQRNRPFPVRQPPAPTANTNNSQSKPKQPEVKIVAPATPKQQSAADAASGTQPRLQTFNPQLQTQNRALLEQARNSIKQNQASEFNRAIEMARQIKPGQPLHAEAKQDIDRWSRSIVDVARTRAKQGEFANAITAAQLVTNDQPIYPEAQQLIKEWRTAAQQQLSNKTLLEAATALIRPGQASTYNRAIDVARQIPTGQPGYDEAQKSINQWSQAILQLAQQRATAGGLKTAIETAALVPEGTPVYREAQQAIGKWKTGKN
jgi:uncharacterized caspase-like protein